MTTTYNFDTPVFNSNDFPQDKLVGYANVDIKLHFTGDRGEWSYSHYDVIKIDEPDSRHDSDLDDIIADVANEYGEDYAKETNRYDQIEMEVAEKREREFSKYLHRNSYTW